MTVYVNLGILMLVDLALEYSMSVCLQITKPYI